MEDTLYTKIRRHLELHDLTKDDYHLQIVQACVRTLIKDEADGN